MVAMANVTYQELFQKIYYYNQLCNIWRSIIYKNIQESTSNFRSPAGANDTCSTNLIGSKSRPDGPFMFTNSQQTLLMACYYYGYFINQIPSGYLIVKFGFKRVIGRI